MIDAATLARVSELHIPVNAGSVDMLMLGQVSPGHRLVARELALVTATARKPTPGRKQQTRHLA